MRCTTTLAIVVAAALVLLAVTGGASAAALSNVAYDKPTDGIVYGGYPTSNGVDGNRETTIHGVNEENVNWWEVNLEQTRDLEELWVTSRRLQAARINGATLRVFGADGSTQIGPDIVFEGFDDAFYDIQTYDNGGSGWTGAQYIHIGHPGTTLPYLNVCEVEAYAMMPTYAGFISGITVTSNNTYTGGNHSATIGTDYLVDNSMMDDQTGLRLLGDPNALKKSTNAGIWHTDATPVEPYVDFDFGGSCNLQRTLVWNSQQGDLNRGFKDVNIEYSTDGVVYTPLDDRNGGDPGNYTIAISTEDEYVSYQADVDLSGITASHVRITALTSHGSEGYWGLAEVRFYQSGSTEPIPGDANRDGKVTDADAAILATNWQKSGASWSDGDFNNDGFVTDADAAILATHWQEGAEGSTAPVPEPTTATLLLAGLAAAAVLAYRKQ